VTPPLASRAVKSHLNHISDKLGGRPDLVLYNANVVTLDDRGPRAEIVTVRGGRIVWVGSNADTSSLQSHDTRSIDCEGGTLIPGFVDAHIHLMAYAASLVAVDCRPPSVASITELQRTLRVRAETVPAGEWVRGSGYDEFALREGRLPTRWELDEAVPDHPIRLNHRSGHACVLNSAAMDRVGITSETTEPPGGTIARDLDSGEPSGLLLEMDDYLDGRIPSLSHEELEEGFRLANKRLVSAGVTSLHDATPSNSPDRWDAFERLKADEKLTPRVTMMAGSDHLDEFLQRGFRFGYGDARLGLGHVKIMQTMSSGGLHPSPRELADLVQQSHKAGFPVAIHAVEAEAVESAADALLAGQFTRPRLVPSDAPRDRIEHCSECPPTTLDKLRRSGATVVTQPSFVYHSGPRYLAKVPEPTRPWLYRTNSFLDAGLGPAAGSDAPVVDLNPMFGVYAAVTRHTESGETLGKQERLSALDALRMHTISGARAAGLGAALSSIEVGKLADMVLLDRDPADVEADEIRDIQVRMTVAGGQVVWEG